MGLVSKVFCTIMVVCGLNVVSIGVQPNNPKPKRQTLSFNSVNGNFSVNIGQFTSYQALDWLHKANSTVRACHCLRRRACQLFATDCCHRSEQHCIKSCRFRIHRAHSDYCKFANGTVGVCTALRIRTCSNLFSQFAASNFSTPFNSQPFPLSKQECTSFGSARDNRALAGDINAINVCYDFLQSTISRENYDTLRLDSLSFTEDYFVVYNGAVILPANPYFVFMQQTGLSSSMVTDGYSPKGKPNTLHSGFRAQQQCQQHIACSNLFCRKNGLRSSI